MKKIYLNILVVLLLGYAFLGFFVVPYYLQHNLSKILQKDFSIETSVDSIYFNPFSFEVKVSNFILRDQKKKNLLFIGTLAFNPELIDLLFNKIYFKYLKIDNLKADIDLDKNQTPNFQFLLQNLQKKKTSKKQNKNGKDSMPIFQVDELKFSYLNVAFSDYSKKELYRFETKPFNIELDNILVDTNNINNIAFKIATKQSGVLSVNSKFQINPLKIQGRVNISKLNVNKVFNYFKSDDFIVDLNSKALDVDFGYGIDILKDDFHVAIEDVALKLPQIKVIQDKYEVTFKEIDVRVKKVDTLLSKDISYDVFGVHLQSKQVGFEDHHINTDFGLKSLKADVTQVSSNKAIPIEFKGSFDMPLKGQLSLQGKALQEPLEIRADLMLQNTSLKPYEAYLQEFVNIGIKSFDIDAKTSVQILNDKTQKINLQGYIDLKDIVLFNTKQNQEILQIKNAHLKNISFRDDFLNIKTININQPFVNFSYNQNKTTNFSYLVVNKKEEQTKKKEKQNSFKLLINNIYLKDGKSSFIDKTITPNFTSKEEQVNIKATNISLDSKIKTTIIHKSVIDKYSLLNAKSTFAVANPLEDLKASLHLQNIDLPRLSAYSGKFIGNKIDNGKLALKLEHTIKKGQLNSVNNLHIKDIKLGQKVESKDAIDAPIESAIALLEDSSGVIDLDIPINGDLKNPSFDISDVIGDVIVNTIVGIVTAPFKFLALLTGLDGEKDISNIGFAFGTSDISVTQKEKLDKIAEALLKRPQVDFQIKPAYHFESDLKALQEKKFQQLHPLVSDSTKKFQELYKYIKKHFIKAYTNEEYEKLEGKEDTKYQDMVQKLQSDIKVDIKEIENLGLQRAKKIREYLISKGIGIQRIKIQEGYTTDKIDTKLNQVIVLFELKLK